MKRDYFTKWIPSDREFRVWAYRSAHLGTYEKVLDPTAPSRHGLGRNFDNGYRFHLLRSADIPRGAVAVAVEAVKTLGLDFGGVDVLHVPPGTPDRARGEFFVLEVNTAPGVEGDARQCINLLVDHIQRWVTKGYPQRRAVA